MLMRCGGVLACSCFLRGQFPLQREQKQHFTKRDVICLFSSASAILGTTFVELRLRCHGVPPIQHSTLKPFQGLKVAAGVMRWFAGAPAMWRCPSCVGLIFGVLRP